MTATRGQACCRSLCMSQRGQGHGQPAAMACAHAHVGCRWVHDAEKGRQHALACCMTMHDNAHARHSAVPHAAWRSALLDATEWVGTYAVCMPGATRHDLAPGPAHEATAARMRLPSSLHGMACKRACTWAKPELLVERTYARRPHAARADMPHIGPSCAGGQTT